MRPTYAPRLGARVARVLAASRGLGHAVPTRASRQESKFRRKTRQNPRSGCQLGRQSPEKGVQLPVRPNDSAAAVSVGFASLTGGIAPGGGGSDPSAVFSIPSMSARI